MEYPKISIVTPSFNSSLTIKECIESVANQNYPNLEHWFIDGYSNDDTLNIIESYAKKHPYIKYISEKDKGIYDAMNKGIDRATGEWIYFLGTDDVICEGVLNELFIESKHQDVDFLYGNAFFINKNYIHFGEFSVTKILQHNICHQAIFFKRNLFENLGYYNVNYTIFADWEFNWRCFSKENIHKRYINLVIVRYNDYGLSYTLKNRDNNFHKNKYKLFIQHFHKMLGERKLYELLGACVFELIKYNNLFYAWKHILYAAFYTKKHKYYILNAFYWSRQRLLKKI